MKQFDWEKFKKKKIAVHCKTEDEADNFLKQADKQNITWGKFGRTINTTCWYGYKEKTCYDFDDLLVFGEGICFADEEYYKSKGYKIVAWSEYMDNYKSDVILPVDDILNRMTERQREIYRLYLQGYTQEKIGEKLGVTQSSVSLTFKRAKKTFDDYEEIALKTYELNIKE